MRWKRGVLWKPMLQNLPLDVLRTIGAFSFDGALLAQLQSIDAHADLGAFWRTIISINKQLHASDLKLFQQICTRTRMWTREKRKGIRNLMGRIIHTMFQEQLALSYVSNAFVSLKEEYFRCLRSEVDISLQVDAQPLSDCWFFRFVDVSAGMLGLLLAEHNIGCHANYYLKRCENGLVFLRNSFMTPQTQMIIWEELRTLEIIRCIKDFTFIHRDLAPDELEASGVILAWLL